MLSKILLNINNSINYFVENSIISSSIFHSVFSAFQYYVENYNIYLLFSIYMCVLCYFINCNIYLLFSSYNYTCSLLFHYFVKNAIISSFYNINTKETKTLITMFSISFFIFLLPTFVMIIGEDVANGVLSFLNPERFF